ncbi:hypothetical protein [Achromobacter marplatensis]|uniref:Uncharacterized protein n=1 Tax=Achromobacter marplatensis TaxID=470868 RepID=A0AA42WC83_9BURK|nr:hypothetical protein [Achromobacter marplatensis]MDH2052543.1 hypothetical protein [Achromobacter marplatensis]
MDLDQVLNGSGEGEPQQDATPAAPPVTEPAPEPKGETPAEPKQAEPATGEPPAPGHEKSVPLSALEAERKQRQDWKEKAIRLEEQLKAAQAPQGQQQAQQPPTHIPVEDVIINERLNMSEMMLRQTHADVDEKIDRFKQELDRNPALSAELKRQTHPYKWAYEYASRLQLMDEIGSDPNAYREKLKEQVKAELAQQAPAHTEQPAAAAAPAPRIPQSLATAHSVGARTAPSWTGPTPLDNILKT